MNPTTSTTSSTTSGALRRGVLIAAAVLVAGCTSGTDTRNAGTRDAIAVEVASFDLVAGQPGRFIVGVWGADKTTLLAHGSVELGFAPVDDPTADAPDPSTAEFLPLPGQRLDPDAPGPRFVSGSEATGVYGADDVVFDQPGFWHVTVTAAVDGESHTATAAFEVHESSQVPAVGDPAPRTRQPLAGDPDTDPRAIDSRARPDGAIPDPELHDTTIADAIDANRPVMVVVSTPTFCVSRFCGPITDIIHELAQRHDDTMTFAHLEVWQDFENNVPNPAALEWIAPDFPVRDGREPWVFVIDRDGIITHRFDNVATEAELDGAIRHVTE